MHLTVINRMRWAHLFFGMMFFYGIEQVFLNEFIGGDSVRGFATVMFTLGVLVFDIPTGILADRIGRKKALLIGCAVLIASLAILGLSRSLTAYLLGAVLYGLFIALWNGAAQALLYDHLAETDQQTRYAKEQGVVYAIFLVGAGIANVTSGFIAEGFGLSAAYFLSIIPAIFAGGILLGIYEPPIERREEAVWYKHLHDIFKEVRRHRIIVLYSLRFIVAEVIFLTIGEFGQIYMLTFGISTVTLGIFWAIDAAFAAGGRYLAHYIQKRVGLFMTIYGLVLAAFALTTQSYGIGLFWLLYGLNEALQNIAETEVQHAASTRVRATTLSIVSFIGNALAIPIVLAYTWYYSRHGIFAANRWIIASMVLLLVVTLAAERRKITTWFRL
jgi:MFS family permease